MKTMTKNLVCVKGNLSLFNNIVAELVSQVNDLADIVMPSPDEFENGFDEDVLTHFGNSIRALEETYNGLIIFARCKAYSVFPIANGLPTPDNDTQSEV